MSSSDTSPEKKKPKKGRLFKQSKESSQSVSPVPPGTQSPRVVSTKFATNLTTNVNLKTTVTTAPMTTSSLIQSSVNTKSLMTKTNTSTVVSSFSSSASGQRIQEVTDQKPSSVESLTSEKEIVSSVHSASAVASHHILTNSGQQREEPVIGVATRIEKVEKRQDEGQAVAISMDDPETLPPLSAADGHISGQSLKQAEGQEKRKAIKEGNALPAGNIDSLNQEEPVEKKGEEAVAPSSDPNDDNNNENKSGQLSNREKNKLWEGVEKGKETKFRTFLITLVTVMETLLTTGHQMMDPNCGETSGQGILKCVVTFLLGFLPSFAFFSIWGFLQSVPLLLAQMTMAPIRMASESNLRGTLSSILPSRLLPWLEQVLKPIK